MKKNYPRINQISKYKKWEKLLRISTIFLPIVMILLVITVAIIVSLESEIWIGILVSFVSFAILLILVTKILVLMEKKQTVLLMN